MARFCVRFAKLRIIIPVVILIFCAAFFYSRETNSSENVREIKDHTRDISIFKKLEKPHANDLSDLLDLKAKETNAVIQRRKEELFRLKMSKVGGEQQQSVVSGKFVPGLKMESLSGKIAGAKQVEDNYFKKSPDEDQHNVKPQVKPKPYGMMAKPKRLPVEEKGPVQRLKAPMAGQPYVGSPARAPYAKENVPHGVQAAVGVPGRFRPPAGRGNAPYGGQTGGNDPARAYDIKYGGNAANMVPQRGHNNAPGLPARGNGPGLPARGNVPGLPARGNGPGLPARGNPARGNGPGLPARGNAPGLLARGNAPGLSRRGNAPGLPARGNAPNGAQQSRGVAPVGLGRKRGRSPPKFEGPPGADLAAEVAQRKAQRQANSLAVQKTDPELVCKSPELKPFDDSIQHLLHNPDRLHCNGSLLTSWTGYRFNIDTTQAGRYDTCFYSSIERINDDISKITDPRKLRLVKQGTQLDFKPRSDFTILGCQKGPQRRQIDIIDAHDPTMHVDIHAHITERADVKETALRYLKKRHKENMGLNVILLGIESTSRMNFMRQMPKSYRALYRMGAVTLSGYNIVGDSTTGNLIPLLVGRHESELPDVRRDSPARKFLDEYNFIWNSFSNAGYVTMFAEDQPKISTFNLRLNGFERQPTDHYMRTFWQEVEAKGHCVGPKPSHQIMLDYTADFMRSYRKFPKFGLTFFTGLTHNNINNIQLMDEDLAQFLETSSKNFAFNNTMFVLFSDHGARYRSIRQTMQGKLEERLPFMSILIPSWLKNSRPSFYTNLMKNHDRLTTPFDIFETMQSILYHRESMGGGYKRRGISLFNEIPKSRTCQEAGIDPHWCSCMQWKTITTQNSTALAKSLILELNGLTKPYRKLCMEQTFLRVVRVERMQPNDDLMRFLGTKDKDEREPEFHRGHTVNVHTIPLVYQLTVETMPGRAMFEGTMKVQPGLNNAFVAYELLGTIKRNNKFGFTANCVEKDHPNIAPYCFCKNYIGMPVAFMGASEKETKVVSHSV